MVEDLAGKVVVEDFRLTKKDSYLSVSRCSCWMKANIVREWSTCCCCSAWKTAKASVALGCRDIVDFPSAAAASIPPDCKVLERH